MTVGELISELKKVDLFDQTSPVVFTGESDDPEHVRLILLDDLKISKVFLAPHSKCCICVCELSDRLNKLGSAFLPSEVFFLTQANEAAKICSVGLSDDGDVVILSDKK